MIIVARRRWRLLMVVAALLGAFAAAGFWRASNLRREAIAQWEQLLGAQAALTESAINGWLEEREADGRLVAQYARSFETLFRPDPNAEVAPHQAGSIRRLQDLLSSVHGSREYGGVWALAPEGQVVAASAGAGDPAGDERVAAIDAMRSGRSGFAIPRRQGGDSPRLTLISLIPAGESGGRASGDYFGAVVLRVNPKATLFRLVGRDPVRTRTGQSGLVARDQGEFIVISGLDFPRAEPLTIRLPWSAAPTPGRLAVEGFETTGTARDIRGESVVYATRHLPSTGWGLVWRLDEAEALADYDRTLYTEFLLALALIGVVALAAITLNRQARMARLRESVQATERLAGIVDVAMEAIITVDEQQRITLFNAAAERLTGCRAAEAIGQPLRRFMPVSHRERHDRDFAEFVRQGGSRRVGRSGRFRILRADGEILPVEASVSTVSVGGQTLYTIVARDIAERQRAEEDVRRSEALFRSFVEHAPYGIYRSTVEGRFTSVNQALVDLLGYASADELLAVDLARDVYRDPAVRERYKELYWRDDRFEARDVEWKRKDGSSILVRISGRHIRDAGGNIEHLEGFVEDVTPLRNAELALRRSEKLAAVGQLISGIAHELNNPLSAILHFAEDLLEDHHEASDVQALTIMREQALRARTIVQDLLIFVRRGQDGREHVDVPTMLERLAVVLRRDVEQIGARLHLEVEPKHCSVIAEPAGLEQVLRNLVLNAAQAAGASGEVSVRVRQEQGRAEIVVEDDGPGIAPEVIARIFEPFFTTKPIGKGTGLGLSVSFGIVERYGGSITAENRAGGQRGARFVVSLPCSDDASEDLAGRQRT